VDQRRREDGTDLALGRARDDCGPAEVRGGESVQIGGEPSDVPRTEAAEWANGGAGTVQPSRPGARMPVRPSRSKASPRYHLDDGRDASGIPPPTTVGVSSVAVPQRSAWGTPSRSSCRATARSQWLNIKLRDVATFVVETGEMPTG